MAWKCFSSTRVSGDRWTTAEFTVARPADFGEAPYVIQSRSDYQCASRLNTDGPPLAGTDGMCVHTPSHMRAACQAHAYAAGDAIGAACDADASSDTHSDVEGGCLERGLLRRPGSLLLAGR